MAGSILWNVIAGASCAALVFLLSFGNNPLATAGTRTLYSFVIGFAVTFAVRWLLKLAHSAKPVEEPKDRQPAEKIEAAETGVGGSIDLTTPEDDVPGFTPLTPPKLASVKSMDPQQLAKAVRDMSEK